MSQITVADAFERLPLTRLTHFTPAKNLYHIVQEGMIRSSKDLRSVRDFARKEWPPSGAVRLMS